MNEQIRISPVRLIGANGEQVGLVPTAQALDEAQDKDLGVPQSREAVASHFGLSVEDVRQIEREGLDASWPPP
jgi:hypothetical protein